MRLLRESATIRVVLLLLSPPGLLGGCPAPTTSGMDGGATPPPDDGTLFADVDGNFTFESATKIAFQASDQTVFDAEVTGSSDIDLFDLGTFAPGDRLLIDVRTTSGNLDPVAALFDSRRYVHAFNDDRAPDSSDLDPRFDVVLRGPVGEYYLGVVAFPGSRTTGRYRVTVQVFPGQGIPAARSQSVYLNWQGGRGVVIRNVAVYDLAPFDASDLGDYPGQTQFFKQRIQQIVRDRYQGFSLLLFSSDDGPPPPEPHSTVHFGGVSNRAFAISEQIDTLNADPSDNAIIYTHSFRGAFSITPTAEQMAVAVGNTTAHEIGHLLGLVHTKDCADLMDTTCGNDSLLVEQAFKLGPLDASVFPVGFQNALELIEWAIGAIGV